MKVTADEVKNAMITKGIEHVEHHRCGLCSYMCKYVRQGDQLFFDPGCNCKYGAVELRTWQEAADWINMQSAKFQATIAVQFGIDVDEVLSAKAVG